jgi:hypothetical protein
MMIGNQLTVFGTTGMNSRSLKGRQRNKNVRGKHTLVRRSFLTITPLKIVRLISQNVGGHNVLKESKKYFSILPRRPKVHSIFASEMKIPSRSNFPESGCRRTSPLFFFSLCPRRVHQQTVSIASLGSFILGFVVLTTHKALSFVPAGQQSPDLSQNSELKIVWCAPYLWRSSVMKNEQRNSNGLLTCSARRPFLWYLSGSDASPAATVITSESRNLRIHVKQKLK